MSVHYDIYDKVISDTLEHNIVLAIVFNEIGALGICSLPNNVEEDMSTTWYFKVAISENQQSESLIEEITGCN